MTTGGAQRPPDTGGGGDGAVDPYAMWDAAYILGALSSAERREYEEHLDSCLRCRTVVADVCGIPTLLGLLDRDEMARADDERPADPPPPRPELLTALLARVRRRRRVRRLALAVGVAAAAVVLALGVLVVIRPAAPGPPGDPPRAVAAQTMTPVVTPSEYVATVRLAGRGWGTEVEMTCTYLDGPDDPGGDDGADELAMVVVGRDGSRTQLATWMAAPGATAVPDASTSMPIDDIASVQIVAMDTRQVLLRYDL